MKEFSIYADWKGKRYKLDCNKFYESAMVQRIRISFGEKAFALQNNFPVIKATPGRPPAFVWKIIGGNVSDGGFLVRVLEELELYLNNEGKPPLTHPRNS